MSFGIKRIYCNILSPKKQTTTSVKTYCVVLSKKTTMTDKDNLRYNLEDKPRLLPMILYGLQWWIVTIPALIVMGLVLAKLHYSADGLAQSIYMQKMFAILGVTLLIQILFGHKLPLVVGPASVLLVGILATISSSIAVIYTAIMIGGIAMALMAVSGVLKVMQKVFTNI